MNLAREHHHLNSLVTSSLSKKSAHNIVQQTIVVNRVHRFIYFHEWWHSFDTFSNRRTVTYQRQIFKACSLYFLNSQTSWSSLFDYLKRLLGKSVYTLEDVAKSLLTAISCLNGNNSFRQSVQIFCSSVWNSNEVLRYRLVSVSHSEFVILPVSMISTTDLIIWRTDSVSNFLKSRYKERVSHDTTADYHDDTHWNNKKISRDAPLSKKDWWNWRWRHLFDVIHLTKNIIFIFID